MNSLDKLSRCFGILLGFAAAACATESPEPLGHKSARIVNGTPTTGSPATVMLQDTGGKGFCSGTLISPHVVLTAAHCLEGAQPAQMAVFFGSQEGGEGTAIPVVHLQANPNGDVGLVAMKDVGPTTPVPAFTGDLAAHVGELVHVVGFGVTSEMGTDFGIKREGMSTLARLEGDSMYNTNTPQGTCYGDSGGPNYMTIDGVEYLAGVTSSGTAECGSGEDIAVRTDTYKDWITAYLAVHEDSACAADGSCNAACPGSTTNDPDCANCSAGNQCQSDCPALDFDCCVQDGMCNQACGIADQDCGSAPPASDAGPSTNPDDEDGDHSGGCAIGGSGGSHGSRLLGIFVGLGLLAWRRRHRAA